MLIDTGVTIACKCTSCGSFEFFDVSMFTLLYKKNFDLPCRCRESNISIKKDSEKSFLIIIPCIGCGNKHTYLFTRKNILSGQLLVFNCPETDIQICFTGKDEAVRRKVDSLEKEFDELINAYGYESYFLNTQVMFDTLNHIHDIALKNNLYCECGSEDIELVLLSDCVFLRCGKCNGSIRLAAAKNEDLKKLLEEDQIVISRNRCSCHSNKLEKPVL